MFPPAWRRLILPLLVIVHVGLGIGFGLVTPIYEAPDEENHYLFIRYLVERRELPVQDLNPRGPRGHHPPLYHLLGAVVSSWVPQAVPLEGIQLPINPSVDYRYGDPRTDNKNQYIHFSDEERWPFQGQALGVHLVRLVSTGFSALAVVFTYLAARQVRPDDRVLPGFAAGLIAVNAMVLFMAGIVQNSTAALAAGAAIVWALARIVNDAGADWGAETAPSSARSMTRWAVLGLAFAAGILLQTSALTLVPVAGAVWLYDLARRGRRGWAAVVRHGALSVSVVSVTTVTVTGWWFWRNWLLYDDPTASNTIAALWTYGPIQPVWQSIEQIGTGLVGRFGQGLMIDYPAPVYWAVWLAISVAIAAGGRRALTVLPALVRRPATLSPGQAQWLMHLSVVASVMVWLYLYVLYYIHGLQGRYLFTAFPSIMILLAGGWLAAMPPRRQAPVAVLSLSVASLLPLYAIFGLIQPTYSPPRLPTAAELNHMQRLDASLGDVASVHGYWLESDSAAPGALVRVSVVWEPLARTATPLTVFAHALDAGGASIGQQDTYPGGGMWATTVWDPGRLFVDTYFIRLAPESSPGSHVGFVLGLYDASSMRRVPVSGADAGSPEEAWVRFGQVVVAGP